MPMPRGITPSCTPPPGEMHMAYDVTPLTIYKESDDSAHFLFEGWSARAMVRDDFACLSVAVSIDDGRDARRISS